MADHELGAIKSIKSMCLPTHRKAQLMCERLFRQLLHATKPASSCTSVPTNASLYDTNDATFTIPDLISLFGLQPAQVCPKYAVQPCKEAPIDTRILPVKATILQSRHLRTCRIILPSEKSANDWPGSHHT